MEWLFTKKGNSREQQFIHDPKRMTDQNILSLQHQIIKDWKSKKESFFLRYSGQGLSILAAIGGIYINNHYRTKLRLSTYGRLSSYLPIVALPAITTGIVHSLIVQPEFMLQKQPCAMCTQIKGGLIHASLAVVYPMVLSPLASFMFASRHYTFRMPEGVKGIFNLYVKMTKPILTPLTVAFCVNMMIGMFVTYREILDFHSIMTRVDTKLTLLENQ